MTRLIAALLRHGDYSQLPNTPSAHQPFALTSNGETQAREAVEGVKSMCNRQGWAPAPCIDSSRLLRAWQTAQIMASSMDRFFSSGFSVESFDVLAERSLGSAANLTNDQIQSVVRQDPRFSEPPQDWKSNSRYCLPLQGAESLMQAGERVASHLTKRLTELQQRVQRDTVKLFVGHGGAFRHAAFHLGVLEFDQIAKLSMHHADPVYLEMRPDQTWRHVAGEWKIRQRGERLTD